MQEFDEETGEVFIREYTLKDAAKYLNLAPTYMTQLMAYETGPKGHKKGRGGKTSPWCFYVADLDQWVKDRASA